jgi:hypothetical protein
MTLHDKLRGLNLPARSGPARHRLRRLSTAPFHPASRRATLSVTFCPMELLRTERLLLRQWDESDVAAFFDLYSREDVARWLGAHPLRAQATVADAQERLGRWVSTSAVFPLRSACGRWSRARQARRRPSRWEPFYCCRSAMTTGPRAQWRWAGTCTRSTRGRGLPRH